MLGEFQVAPEHVDGLPAASTHDRSRVMAGAEQVLGGTDPERVTTERQHLVRLEARPLGAILDQLLDRAGAQAAIDRLALVDRAEEVGKSLPAPVEPIRDEARGGARRERYPPMPERVRLAAADEYSERAVVAPDEVTGRQGHQFRTAGEQFIAEGQHGPVAQTPDRVGLYREEGIEIAPCQPLGLARAAGLLAPHAPDRQIDVFGEGRVGEIEQAVRLTNGIEAPPHGRGGERRGLVLEEGADGFGSGGEGGAAMIIAPALEDCHVGHIRPDGRRGIGTIKTLEFRPPVVLVGTIIWSIFIHMIYLLSLGPIVNANWHSD